jgi:hypothetical protein
MQQQQAMLLDMQLHSKQQAMLEMLLILQQQKEIKLMLLQQRGINFLKKGFVASGCVWYILLHCAFIARHYHVQLQQITL